MMVLVPGHVYWLDTIDGFEKVELQFVCRIEPPEKYPGNERAFPGTTSQEVLRVLIDRLHYIDAQRAAPENAAIKDHLISALALFERRAARVHGAPLDATDAEIAIMPTCKTCGHVYACGHG